MTDDRGWTVHQGRTGGLHLEVVEIARQRDFAWVSLGSAPNLYGHLAKPGLFGFKYRLGFSAIPSHVIDPDSGSDQADRIVGLSAFTDPSFVLILRAKPGRRAPPR